MFECLYVMRFNGPETEVLVTTATLEGPHPLYWRQTRGRALQYYLCWGIATLVLEATPLEEAPLPVLEATTLEETSLLALRSILLEETVPEDAARLVLDIAVLGVDSMLVLLTAALDELW